MPATLNRSITYHDVHVLYQRQRLWSTAGFARDITLGRMTQYLHFFAIALMVTTSASAGGVIADDVFVRAAEKIRQTINSSGTDRAALIVEQCYLQANEQEREFGPIHATCVTQDYLLTTVLALPYDRGSWWPPTTGPIDTKSWHLHFGLELRTCMRYSTHLLT